MKYILILFLSVYNIYAIDTVFILKNGESIKAELIDENENNIVYRNLKNGNTSIISKEEIYKIEYIESNSQIEKLPVKKKQKKQKKQKFNKNEEPILSEDLEMNLVILEKAFY